MSLNPFFPVIIHHEIAKTSILYNIINVCTLNTFFTIYIYHFVFKLQQLLLCSFAKVVKICTI